MNATAAVSRFDFGRNWQSFSATIDDASIAQAMNGMRKLFPHEELAGARMLDVGCGAGLSMLAALRVGASYVHGVDVDKDSIAAAHALLTTHAPSESWSLEPLDLFDLPNQTFDIVHSWGVLHHTSAMWRALDHVSRLVRPGGWLAIALYRRSLCCPFWHREKRLYSKASPSVQAIARSIYKTAFLAGVAATGRNPIAYVRNFRSSRGMSFHHDVHDWLGGYPYESAAPTEIASFLTDHGFSIERSFVRPAAVRGLFGSHCDEYVARLVQF